MSTVVEILRMLREYRFDSVIPLVTQTLRDAAAESPQRLIEVAREPGALAGDLQEQQRPV
jgi:hypothetical protein